MKFGELLTTEIHDAGADMEVTHPATGEPTGVFIRVRGIDSRTYRAAAAEYQRKLAKAKTDDEKESAALDLDVAITAGWRGIDDMEFSADAARKLYSESPSIRAQVASFFVNRRNFKAS